MFTPIPTLLQGPKGYEYTFVPSPAPPDLCLICREPYTTPDGCCAIRLTSCEHTVGLACFEEWSRRNPGICPYWNHQLVGVPLHQYSGRWLAATLLWTSGTMWFRAINYMVLHLPYFGLNDWLDNTENIYGVGHLGNEFTGYFYAIWFLLFGAFDIFVVPYAVMLCVAYVNETNVPGRLKTAFHCVFVVLGVLVCNALVYLAVVGCVFGVRWWWVRMERAGRFRV